MNEPLYSLTREGKPLAMKHRNEDASFFWRDLQHWAAGEGAAMFETGEFAADNDQAPQGMSRRRFIQLMGASLALGGLEGCSRQPAETMVPYVQQPENMVPGRPLSYATATVLSGFGRGVVVTTNEGRPIKVEGNRDHPDSLGATDVYDQASVLGLYDPDRSQAVLDHGQIRTWDAFAQAWQQELSTLNGDRGRGVAIITGNFTSLALMQQLRAMLDSLPEARWFVHEPTLRPSPGEALPIYDLARASIIVALDSDLLHTGAGHVRYAMDFADGRRVRRDSTTMNRLYVAEPMPTVTGAKADHRVSVRGSRIAVLAAALAQASGIQGEGAALTETEARWVGAVAHDLLAHRGDCLIVAGPSQPPRVHAAVAAMNRALGNVGRSVRYVQPFDAAGDQASQSLADLDARGDVRTLLILGCNPAYDAPANLDFARLLEHTPLSIHYGLHVDETARQCHWHLPAIHEMEMWSDVRAYDGTATIIQPMILPLYRGRSPHELLALLNGDTRLTGYEIVRSFWREHVALDGDSFELWWRRSLRDGVVADSAAHTVSPPPEISLQFAIPPTTSPRGNGQLELCIQPDPSVWDGRFANNAWLQELPKPISKLTWDNAAMLNPATATRLGTTDGEMLRIMVDARHVDAPAWIVPGVADDVITIHLGYGRLFAGSVGDRTGFNAYDVRTTAHPWYVVGIGVNKLGRRHLLATTQHHQRMEGRPLQRTASLAEFRRDPLAAAGPRPANPAHTLMPEHVFDYEQGYKWGMSIDLTTCIGCGVCTIACQAENNIPVVGKVEVDRGREMHWIRVDRYYEGPPEDPEIRHQPVPCMHCEHAPCELVCPTGATQHSTEGLNQMTYNRCVGTRYCSHNCPYKVRRFNFFDYVRAATQPDILRMVRNPHVTVRSRGVMEKCTYCVQRIEAARIEAHKVNRTIGGDEVVPACAAACPTQAIVFGDLNQPQSKVAQLHQQPHAYGLLAELNTRPRTTYLSEIRNPNPLMADSRQDHA
jgi:molybdopterin-containing oxidoreductase family iron-sulfur binding subunit